MTTIDFCDPRPKPCLSEWAARNAFALCLAFCLGFWALVGFAVSLAL